MKKGFVSHLHFIPEFENGHGEAQRSCETTVESGISLTTCDEERAFKHRLPIKVVT